MALRAADRRIDRANALTKQQSERESQLEQFPDSRIIEPRRSVEPPASLEVQQLPRPVARLLGNVRPDITGKVRKQQEGDLQLLDVFKDLSIAPPLVHQALGQAHGYPLSIGRGISGFGLTDQRALGSSDLYGQASLVPDREPHSSASDQAGDESRDRAIQRMVPPPVCVIESPDHAANLPCGRRGQDCTCDPRHLEVGGYDPGCPVHSQEASRV